MTMKQKQIYVLAASALLMMSGCARQVNDEQPQAELKVVVGVDGTVASAPSRAGFTTADAPATFGLSAFGYNNLLMTNNGTDWTVSGRTVMWQAQSGTFDVAAYAPYAETIESNTTLSTTVPSDQTTTEKIKATDYLAMSTSTIGTTNESDAYITDGKLGIKLYHKLSKLNVAIAFKQDFAPNADGSAAVSNVSLQIGAIDNQFDLDVSTATLTATSSSTTGVVNMYSNSETSFEGIFVPQTAALTLTLKFDLGSETNLRYSATLASTVFESGKSYALTLNVSRSTMTVGTITVANWDNAEVTGGELTE